MTATTTSTTGANAGTTRPPFAPKAATPRRLKILVFGETGSGKTRFALTLPRLCVIDTEGGTDHYDGDYHVLHTQDPDEIRRVIDWLARSEHSFSSLAIDSFSVVWDALQKKWSEIFLSRLPERRAHHHEFFELGPREWMTIKSDHKDLVARLLRLDMNVIVTCRQKIEYETGAGDFLRRVGTTYDGEKGLAYAFDLVLELWRAKGKTHARALKDRTGKLPAESFEVALDFLEKTYPGVLTRACVPVDVATDEELERIRELAGDLGVDMGRIERHVRELGFRSLEDLPTKAATDLQRKLENALERRQPEVK